MNDIKLVTLFEMCPLELIFWQVEEKCVNSFGISLNFLNEGKFRTNQTYVSYFKLKKMNNLNIQNISHSSDVFVSFSFSLNDLDAYLILNLNYCIFTYQPMGKYPLNLSSAKYNFECAHLSP